MRRFHGPIRRARRHIDKYAMKHHDASDPSWGPTIVDEQTLAAMDWIKAKAEREAARARLTNGTWHPTTGYAE